MPQFIDGTTEIAAVEKNDGGRDEVERCRAGLLVLQATVAKPPEPMEGDSAGQAVACLALVEFGGDRPAQIGVVEPAQREQCALDPSDLPKCRSKTVLLTIGGQLLQNQRRCDSAVAHRRDDLRNFGPMADDQVPTEAAPEQRCEPTIAPRGLETIELSIRQARNARLEIEAEQMHDGEHDIGDAATIGVEGGDVRAAFVAEDAVECVDRLARRPGDDRLMKRCVSIGDGGVDLDHGVATVMCVDRSSGFAGTAEIISLPIGRCAMPRTKPGGERFGMDSVGQAGERGAKRFLAHMPRLHTQQCATRGDTANFGHARQTKVGRLRDQGGKKGAFVGGRQTGRDMAEML